MTDFCFDLIFEFLNCSQSINGPGHLHFKTASRERLPRHLQVGALYMRLPSQSDSLWMRAWILTHYFHFLVFHVTNAALLLAAARALIRKGIVLRISDVLKFLAALMSAGETDAYDPGLHDGWRDDMLKDITDLVAKKEADREWNSRKCPSPRVNFRGGTPPSPSTWSYSREDPRVFDKWERKVKVLQLQVPWESLIDPTQ